MARVEVIKGGQRVENVIVQTPQPMSPAGALPPDIGYVEIGVSDDRGSIWMTGQGPPTQDAGQPGDMYLDMDTGKVWRWDGTEWVLQGTFAPSTDTPEEILAKLITVDGAGSLLDADTLDGMDSTEFATAVQMGIAEGNITTLQGEMDAVEAKNVTQDTAIAGKANAVHTHPQSDITNLVADLALKAPLASPALTGNPTAPTPSPGDADTSIATTAFVGAALAALPPSGIGEAPIDNKTYGRMNAAWAAVVGGAIISDTPPANPQPGQMWLESDSGNTFIFWADADSSQWVQQNIQPAIATNPNAGLTAQTRNRICNPAMQISQENGTTAGTTSAYFGADQWYMQLAHGGTSTSQRVAAVTPNGSPYRYRLTQTVADAALAVGDYLFIGQVVEGIRIADFRWGSASARQVILRFGFKAPAGTYSIVIRNGAASDRCYIQNFTISAGQAGVDTEQVFVVPGETTGTWATDTSAGLLLRIVLAAGTSFQGVVGWQAANLQCTAANTNGMVTAGAVFELYDVGLYLDPLNTGLPPRWEMPDEAQELAACMRYWESGDTGQPSWMRWYGNTTTGIGYYTNMPFKVMKRAAPTIFGTNQGALNFPTSSAAISGDMFGIYEGRVSNLTASGSYFRTSWTANARM